MLKTILLVLIGTPVLMLGIGIWICCAIALWDAVSAYCHSNHIRKLMARRWPDEN